MRWPALLVLLPPLLSGCVLGALEDSGRDCPAGEPVEDGFRVAVAESVGSGRNLARTHGYCVAMHAVDGAAGAADAATDARSVREGLAWFPVAAPGTYRFLLSIREPQDPYCAYWFEAEARHDGTGVVDVELPYEGVSSCA